MLTHSYATCVLLVCYMQSMQAQYSGSNATFGFGADSVLTFGFGVDFGAAWETPNCSN